MTATVLQAKNIVRDYHVGGGMFSKPRTIHAVKGVSFSVEKGRTLAIVGESGCGKSTLARIITMIDAPTAGELFIDGRQVDIAKDGLSKEMRRKVQIVFQNPTARSTRARRSARSWRAALINTHGAGERREWAMAMLKKACSLSTITLPAHVSGASAGDAIVAR